MENKEQCCGQCCINNKHTHGACAMGCICPCHQSPHQEPVATQHDIECKGCGGVSCKNTVLKGGTVCPSCFEKMTTQEPICDCKLKPCEHDNMTPKEPMEWAKAFDKEFNYANFCWNGDIDTGRKFAKQEMKRVKQFISSQITQAEERHNQDCTREEWARASERERIIKEIPKIIDRYRVEKEPMCQQNVILRVVKDRIINIITNQ